LDKAQKKRLKEGTLSGTEIVDATTRLAAMNLYLHEIGGDEWPITVADSLNQKPSTADNIVLTNPAAFSSTDPKPTAPQPAD
jgi:type I restriction enzyme M protein